MLLNILFTIFLVLLNGFFVAAEFSIVKVRTSQLELRIRAGSPFSKMALNIVEHIDSYLSATQLGITLASLGLGWIGESVVAEIIKSLMLFLGINLTSELIHKLALPAAFLTITFLHIIFGELAPKSIAIQRSEQVALLVSLPLRIFFIVFRPLIYILNTFANLLIKSIGFEAASEIETLHSAEEIRYLLHEGSKSGIIDRSEHQLLENVFEFSDTPVKQIMVPRGRIIGIETSMSSQDILDKFTEEGYSRMPVYEKSIDNIIGVLYAKDLISMFSQSQTFKIKDLIRHPYFVHEDEKINILVKDMQKHRVHLSIVMDEFGGTAGMVTLEDIIEEIFGEIQDEYDEELPILESIKEHEYKINALASIQDINHYLPEALPESDDYETVSGLITSETGRIPDENEIIPLGNYDCKILKRSERFIEQVLLIFIGKVETEEE